MNPDIHPLTPERWGDFEKLFGPSGAYGGCWCMWPRLRSSVFRHSTGKQNKPAMRSLVDSGVETGLIAYIGAEPVGWVSLGPREELPHFEYSRKLKALDRPEGLWSIVCFVIGRQHRGRGMTSALLEAAIAYAREHGAQTIEAYPIEPAKELKGFEGFTGIASTFRKAGFETTGGTPQAPIMRYYIEGRQRI